MDVYKVFYIVFLSEIIFYAQMVNTLCNCIYTWQRRLTISVCRWRILITKKHHVADMEKII